MLIAALAIAQYGRCFARIVVAVVEEENDVAADLALEAAGCDDFCIQKSFRKKAAWLLAETDDRRAHPANGRDGALRRPSVVGWRRGGRRSAPSLPGELIGL